MKKDDGSVAWNEKPTPIKFMTVLGFGELELIDGLWIAEDGAGYELSHDAKGGIVLTRVRGGKA